MKPNATYRHVVMFFLALMLAGLAFVLYEREPEALAAPSHTAPPAQEPVESQRDIETNELVLKTERVIVFKDGYSLFVKRGIARTNASGEIFSEQVPDAAVLGSFWATPSTGRLLSMTAGRRATTEVKSSTLDCLDVFDVLRANIGRLATIELDRDHILDGRIAAVLEERVTTPVQPSSSMYLSTATSFAPDSRAREVTSARGNLFVLRTEEGDTLVPVERVTRVTIEELETQCARETKTTQTAKRLTFFFEEPGATREIVLMYFVPDLRWLPTYRADLSARQGTGTRVSLQAEILNEREDLIDVPVELVVGVPHFRFKDTISPFSLESTLRSTLHQVAPQLMSQNVALSNASFDLRATERLASPVSAVDRARPELDLPPELSGVTSQDLFVYTLPPLTLLKGDRAAVPLFTADVSTRNVYTWNLHVKRSGDHAANDASPLQIAQNDVWHELVLSNRTRVPWTTGPILFLEDGRPLGQELLTYTSRGRDVRVPVTRSVDTRGDYRERETGRTLDALEHKGKHYARIDVEGELRVSNAKEEPVDVEVTARLGGQVDATSHNGVVTVGGFDRNDWTASGGSPEVNGHTNVAWKVSLQPGEIVSLTVRYHYFIRH